MSKFCGFRNIPNALNRKAYKDCAKVVKEAYCKTAHVSMLAASNELLAQRFGDESTDDSVANIEISTDGAWQRRGYASLNGLVTVVAMDTNKCVDFEVLSKTCKTCEVLEKGGVETYKNHDCGINHEGSAGSMESAGVMTHVSSVP